LPGNLVYNSIMKKALMMGYGIKLKEEPEGTVLRIMKNNELIMTFMETQSELGPIPNQLYEPSPKVDPRDVGRIEIEVDKIVEQNYAKPQDMIGGKR
jgi:hypothetical protein